MPVELKEKESEFWLRKLNAERFASKDEYESVKFRYWDAIRREQGEQKNPVGFWYS